MQQLHKRVTVPLKCAIGIGWAPKFQVVYPHSGRPVGSSTVSSSLSRVLIRMQWFTDIELVYVKVLFCCTIGEPLLSQMNTLCSNFVIIHLIATVRKDLFFKMGFGTRVTEVRSPRKSRQFRYCFMVKEKSSQFAIIVQMNSSMPCNTTHILN